MALGRVGIASAALVAFGLVIAPGGCNSNAPTPCATTPTPPAQDAFCVGLANYDGRCGHCSDCTAQNLQNCAKLGTAVSDAYRAAFVQCIDAVSCDTDPTRDPCVLEAMKKAGPTAAQNQAKKAYCDLCKKTNASDCADFFNVDTTSGMNGIGYGVLVYGDAVASTVVTLCNECDPGKYAICIALASCNSSGGDFCVDSGICAP
jgi:hypothetical protein